MTGSRSACWGSTALLGTPTGWSSTPTLGQTADGQMEQLSLRADVTGITRVELEVALPQMLEDPSQLEAVALAYEARHPGVDLVALEVRQQVHQLSGGARAGAAEDRFVLRWEQ